MLFFAMGADLTYQRMRVATDIADDEGLLVMWRGKLVAVLMQVPDPNRAVDLDDAWLSEAGFSELSGAWSVAAGFGPCADPVHQPLPSLAEAIAWVVGRTSDIGARPPAELTRRRSRHGRRGPKAFADPTASSSLDAKTVLVVEDDPLVRLFLLDVLQDEGYRVLEAAHADEALTHLSARPDVLAVVTDVRMPGATGYDLAREIYSRHPKIKVVIMSGVTEPERGDLPANAVFISKPMTPAVIVGEVNRAVIGTLDAGAKPATI